MIVLDKEDLNKIEFRWNHEVELSSYGREFFVSKAKISKNTNQEEKKIMKKMNQAAAELNFELAASLRDQMVELKKSLQEME